jgi:hypothetical protein
VKRHHDHAVAVPDHHVAREHRDVAAGDRAVDLDRLMDGEASRGRWSLEQVIQAGDGKAARSDSGDDSRERSCCRPEFSTTARIAPVVEEEDLASPRLG